MRRVSVLLVDGDDLILRATARRLRDDLDVRMVDSASGALKELAGALPDVVVVDLDLTGAVRLMQRISEDHPAIRRLLVSWWPNADQRSVPPGLVEQILPRCDAPALIRAIRGAA